MLRVRQAIVVEGKYDKIKLSSIVDGVILQTDGYGIFKDREKLDLIRFYAHTTGVIVLTDSDSAGFRIRNYLKGAIGEGGSVVNVYVPDVFGKERRKAKPSAEGKLGVEGMDADTLLEALRKANVLDASVEDAPTQKVTHTDLYTLGLSGAPNSRLLRSRLLRYLDLPERLTTNGLLEVLNTTYSLEELEAILDGLSAERTD